MNKEEFERLNRWWWGQLDRHFDKIFAAGAYACVVWFVGWMGWEDPDIADDDGWILPTAVVSMAPLLLTAAALAINTPILLLRKGAKKISQRRQLNAPKRDRLALLEAENARLERELELVRD